MFIYFFFLEKKIEPKDEEIDINLVDTLATIDHIITLYFSDDIEIHFLLVISIDELRQHISVSHYY